MQPRAGKNGKEELKRERAKLEETDHFEEMDLSENGNLDNNINFYCNKSNFNLKYGIETKIMKDASNEQTRQIELKAI